MTLEAKVRVTDRGRGAKGGSGGGGGRGRLTGMLGSIKEKDITGNRFGGDEILILGHVPGTIDLALMGDLLGNVETGGRSTLGSPVPTHLTPILIVLYALINDREGKVNMGDLEVILLDTRGVSAQEKPLYCVILVWGPKERRVGE